MASGLCPHFFKKALTTPVKKASVSVLSRLAWQPAISIEERTRGVGFKLFLNGSRRYSFQTLTENRRRRNHLWSLDTQVESTLLLFERQSRCQRFCQAFSGFWPFLGLVPTGRSSMTTVITRTVTKSNSFAPWFSMLPPNVKAADTTAAGFKLISDQRQKVRSMNFLVGLHGLS